PSPPSSSSEQPESAMAPAKHRVENEKRRSMVMSKAPCRGCSHGTPKRAESSRVFGREALARARSVWSMAPGASAVPARVSDHGVLRDAHDRRGAALRWPVPCKPPHAKHSREVARHAWDRGWGVPPLATGSLGFGAVAHGVWGRGA